MTVNRTDIVIASSNQGFSRVLG